VSKTAQYIAFYSVFLLVFFGMHLYVYLRLKKMFSPAPSYWYFVAVVVLALSFPACTLLEKFFPNTVTMLLYTVAAGWLGVLFLFLSTLVVLEPVRPFMNINTPFVGKCVVVFVAVLSMLGIINALFIRVTEVRIPLAGLEKPVRAAMLSDLHVGTIHNSGFLKRIVSKTNNLQPEVVFITGDFFDGTGPITEKTVLPLSGLQVPSFFVMGNHEKFFGMDRVQRLIEPTGVRVLRNAVAQYRGLQIIGIDNPERENRKDNEQIHRVAFDRSRPNVLLYHTPVGIEDARRAGVMVQLSGHTHNGQLYPFNLLVKLFYPYTRGLYDLDGLLLYVTPGSGTWGPPMRLGSSNEITLITFVPAPATST
jgi:predicted MPP superfamily phosphohydrolase